MAISSHQQQLLSSLHLCKYSFPLSLPNFHSLSPPKHALQRDFSLLRAQVTHFETKTSTNFTTNGKSLSGLSNSGTEHNRVVEKNGENSFGLLERKIFEKGSSTSTTINCSTNRKSPSGLSNSVGEDKRVVEKFEENSVGLVESRNLGHDAAQVSHFETKISSINGKSPSQTGGENKRIVKENGKGIGIVKRRNLEKGSRKRREIDFGVSPVTKISSSSTNNWSTTGKFPSGLTNSIGEDKRALKKIGENGIGVAEREIFEKGFSTSTTINCSTDVKYPSGLSNSGGENKRVVEKIGGNGVGLVERGNFEKGSRKRREIGPGVSPRSSKGEIFVEELNNEIVKALKNGMDDEIGEDGVGLVERRDFGKGSRKWREFGSGVSPRSSKGKIFLKKLNNEIGKKSKKSMGGNKENIGKRDKKSKLESPGLIFRVGLDMCSKNGDVMGALKLYDKAQLEDIELRQYHYTVLLYLCSSAAIGVVNPAKSGTGGRSLSIGEVSTLNSISSNEIAKKINYEVGNAQSNNHVTKNGKPIDSDRVGELDCQLSNEPNRLWRDDDYCDLAKVENDNNPQNKGIRVSDDLRKDALKRGFEIYKRMRLEKVPMNEASLTSIARMALAMGDGDMAFDMVKQMTELGINPRLRSYGPALSAFCNSGNIDKAFLVEEHMLAHGVCPEEPEFEALLRVCLEGNRSDKVYYLLHKLRTNVRQVSPSTADLLEKWFTSNAASKVGKRKWDERELRKTIEKGGGGWHGKGWLGKGKWTISKTSVGKDGVCKCCGEKLATIDLDPVETEKFAESVASIAAKREKKSSFQQFQKWLDYYGPFEAVVDAANIGLLTQRKFKPSKVNAVVNGIRHMLPSKKWPLIVLHNRRVTDDIMDKPMNKAILEKWKNADALYATPTGSNDDWYWLYAAIKFKCLLVTNDEMRDHLFQLLGNDFFPRWKERHQVHFSFSEVGPVFHMPPPCSVVIQESEKGHWHIPIASEHKFKEERKWLCVVRDKSEDRLKSAATLAGSDISDNGATESRDYQTNTSTTIVASKYWTILPNIEAAEKLGGYVVDFEI